MLCEVAPLCRLTCHITTIDSEMTTFRRSAQGI